MYVLKETANGQETILHVADWAKEDKNTAKLECWNFIADKLLDITRKAVREHQPTHYFLMRDYMDKHRGQHMAGIMDTNGETLFVYDVVWVNDNVVDEYNQKLREKWGYSLILHICEVYNDDDEPEYYFTGSTIDESDHYSRIEDCYNAADEYLDCLTY